MNKPIFLQTSKGIINRSAIIVAFPRSAYLELILHDGCSFRFEGQEAAMILQCLVPSIVTGNSSELKSFLHNIDLSPEQHNELSARLFAQRGNYAG